jgi:hypothetical protein
VQRCLFTVQLRRFPFIFIGLERKKKLK